MADMLVSVVLPTFNRSALVVKAAESALRQTHSHLEVLVIDDGSTDDTGEAIGRIPDKRVRYFRQENAGVSAARNLAMAEARGDYIAFLDSDDVWLPWKLEAQLAVFARYPDVGLVWTDMAAVDHLGREVFARYLIRMYSAYRHVDRDRLFSHKSPLEEVWPACPQDLKGLGCYVGRIYPWIIMGNLVHTSTAVLRRDWQQRLGELGVGLLPEGGGEDYSYYLQASRLGRAAFIDASSTLYRIGAPDQLTEPSRLLGAARNALTTVETALAQDEAVDLPPSLIQERIASCHAWIGTAEFHVDRQAARRHLRLALASAPLRYSTVWWRCLAYYLLSYLPLSVFGLVRRAVRAARSAKH